MIVRKFEMIGIVLGHQLDQVSLILIGFDIPRVEVDVHSGPYLMYMHSRPIFWLWQFPIASQMLRVEDKVVRDIVNVFQVNIDIGQSIESDIMVSHAHDQRHQTV